MSVFHNNVLSGAAGQTGGDAAVEGQIKSLRFDSGDSAHLSKTFSSAGNRRTWTWSGWFKRQKTESMTNILFASYTNSSNRFYIGIQGNSDKLLMFGRVGGSDTLEILSNQVFRDFGAWYHMVVAIDSTQSSASDRVKVYVNGSQISLATTTALALNAQTYINAAASHRIGNLDGGSLFNGYQTDVHFIDGSALDATSFGSFDDNGVWQAAEYDGTFGTNGFHLLDFANESTVGHDSSGNENDFTANNILENNNEAADFNAALSSTPFSDSSASSISITNTGSISTSSAGSNNFSISNAAEFTGGSNSGLTLGSAVDRTGLYTLDMYFKLDNLDQQMRLLTNESTTTGNALGAKEQGIAVATDGSINVYDYGNAQLAPASAISANTWYHYRLIADGTTIKASYLNGTAQTTSGSIQNFAANTALRIGYGSTSVSHSTDGLIGPIRIVPGNLGAPPSGGLSTTSGALSNSAAAINLGPGVDVLFDVPTNGTQSDTGAGGEVSGNYCTLNPLHSTGMNAGTGAAVLSNGNLDATSNTSAYKNNFGTIVFPASGKYYFEVTVLSNNGTNNQTAGIAATTGTTKKYLLDCFATSSTSKRSLVDSSATSLSGSFNVGDVIGVAVDCDAGTAVIKHNNTDIDSGYTLDSSLTYAPFFSGYNCGTSAFNFGQRAWAYSAPSNHKALCTTNLPTPDVADGSDYFNTALWTGDGGSSVSVTTGTFEPDFIWIKQRNKTYYHQLYDAVRGYGSGKALASNENVAEGYGSPATYGYVSGTTSTGFTGTAGTGTPLYVNENNTTYVAWNWDAGSSTASNTDGSVTSSVRANQTAGFSIIKYTAGSSAVSIGHGLNVTPAVFIQKNMDSTDIWRVYYTVADGSLDFLRLNTTASKSDSSNSLPTSSVINIGGISGDDHIVYAFTPVAAYSAMGVYSGNSSTNGVFVHTNFRPAWLMVKSINATGSWSIFDSKRDTFNVMDRYLYAEQTFVEQDSDTVDFLSNGFKFRTGGGDHNYSGRDYLYLAFAENPFQANGGLAR